MNVQVIGDELTIVFEVSQKNFIDKEEEAGKRAGHMVKGLGSLTFHNYNGLVKSNSGLAGDVIYHDGFLSWSSTSTATSTCGRLDFHPVEEGGSIPVFARVRSDEWTCSRRDLSPIRSTTRSSFKKAPALPGRAVQPV